MDRRSFIKDGTIYALAVSVFGLANACSTQSIKAQTENIPDSNDPNPCLITSNDILGPFYRKKAPNRKNLRKEEEQGTPIRVAGHLYQSNCEVRIPNAKIEIWHADHEGEYDNESEHFHYRSTLITDENGFYEFETILPGQYLNGSQFRPSHIHFMISAPDYQQIISQIYFENDPYIEKDPWASQEKAVMRILPLQKEKDGQVNVQFDIIMRKA